MTSLTCEEIWMFNLILFKNRSRDLSVWVLVRAHWRFFVDWSSPCNSDCFVSCRGYTIVFRNAILWFTLSNRSRSISTFIDLNCVQDRISAKLDLRSLYLHISKRRNNSLYIWLVLSWWFLNTLQFQTIFGG